MATDTFYSSQNDGVCYYTSNTNRSWATQHDAAASEVVLDNPGGETLIAGIGVGNAANTFRNLIRSFFLFDTSSLPDGATITSATISIYGTNKDATNDVPAPDIGLVATTPASDTAIATGDYDQQGTTLLSNTISYNSWSTTGYNTFTLNASGLSAISKTGITKLGFRIESDRTNTAPTGDIFYSGVKRVFGYFYTNNASVDPKLEITYTVPASGPANLKSYNTNLKANIKSINTNLIANVKSLDTNV